jgi:hypothetical protein
VLRIGICLCVLSGAAAADELRRIEVKVDATIEVEVGNLIGFRCDHRS